MKINMETFSRNENNLSQLLRLQSPWEIALCNQLAQELSGRGIN